MRMLRWASKILLTVVLVSILTIFTTGYIVNTYLKSMLESFNIQLPSGSLTMGSILQGMMGIVSKDEKVPQKDQSTIEPDEVEDTEDQEAPVGALPVMGESYTEEAGSIDQDTQVIITPDEMVRKKDGLIDKDKEEIFTILMTKVPQDKIQEITVAMENGLTEQELKNVEAILSKYLNKDEYDKLLLLLKR
ncbi:hypothetical protein ACH8E3_11720 [Paenibacillus sp. CMAA1364]